MNNKGENEYTLVNQARGYLTDAVGQIMNRFALPAYIMDGLLSDILAEIRKKEIYDMSVINLKQSLKEHEEDENGEHLRTDQNNQEHHP